MACAARRSRRDQKGGLEGGLSLGVVLVSEALTSVGVSNSVGFLWPIHYSNSQFVISQS